MLKLLYLPFITFFIAGPAFSKVSISAHYREPANSFDIVDCVSKWWDGTFCNDEGAYQKEWENRFGISDEDRNLFKKYDSFRRKYFHGMGLPNVETNIADGLFSKRRAIDEDPVAPAFYSSQTLEEAYTKLSKITSKEDLDLLRSIHAHFKPQLQVLLGESRQFQVKAEKLNRRLQDIRYQKFFTDIARYYETKLDIHYEVLFSWWPPVERDNASPTDRFLILRKNPLKHINWSEEDIVFHEIVHTISARQPQENKERHSNDFLKICPINGRLPVGQILEEVLAVAIGQIYFLNRFDPKSLVWESKLYSKPWVSSFAKIVYPVLRDEIESGKIFTSETAVKLGKLCAEYLAAMDSLKMEAK